MGHVVGGLGEVAVAYQTQEKKWTALSPCPFQLDSQAATRNSRKNQLHLKQHIHPKQAGKEKIHQRNWSYVRYYFRYPLDILNYTGHRNLCTAYRDEIIVNKIAESYFCVASSQTPHSK